MKDGQLVYMLERREIETSGTDAIAERLQRAMREHCTQPR